MMTLAVQNAGTSGYEFTLELQSAVAVTALSTCGLRGEYIERRVAGQESEVGRRRVGGAAAALHKPFDRIFEGCVGKPSSLFLGFFIVFYSLCKGVWCATSSSSTYSQPLVLHSQKETFANDHVRVILCHSATIGLLLQFRMPCNADREDVIRCVVTFSFCLHFPVHKGAHMVTDVGPSRDRTAADHSTVTTHLDLAITKANLPDMRATVDVGAEDSTLVCSSAVLSTRGLGGAVAGGQTWIGGQTMTAIPRF